MDSSLKEVYFDEYCSKCKNANVEESEDPCWECLSNPVNENSHKPTMFQDK